MHEFNACLADHEARHSFPEYLLSAFDEISQTFLKAARDEVHTFLQRYLDGKISIGGDYSTRRAILLAIHDIATALLRMEVVIRSVAVH